MDDEGEGGYVDGGDRNDQFHRNEAISAVVDEGFLGEDEDDYEDLYNDVNVNEGIFQSLSRNEDSGFRKEEEEKKIDLAVEPAGVSIPGVGSGAGSNVGGGEKEFEKDEAGFQAVSKDPPRLDSFQDLGNRGNELASKGSVLGPGVGGGMRVELGQSSGKNQMNQVEVQTVNSSAPSRELVQPSQVGSGGNVANEGFARQGGVVAGHVNGFGGSTSGGGGAGTILFVGDLHWWTTDAQLEAELCKYGMVKEVKFFDEKASGKSKGFCQVEFYDPAAATACKERMNGYVFNGRPCLVAYATPYSVKKMGEAQMNKNQQMAQATVAQGGRVFNGAGGRGTGSISNTPVGGNYQGGDGGRNYGRGNWGRGGGAQGMGNRGQIGPMRNRIGGMGGRGIIGNGGNGFAQGLAATPPLLHHPQTMMGQGFDPSYGTHMGRMGGFGGFPAALTPPFSGLMQSFPPVGGMGLPGVAPHVNPAFFGRGMPTSGMGVMPVTGVEGHGMGMWSDPNAAGWGSEEHVGRAGESSYGDDAASDHQYGEASHERGGWSTATKERERTSEREWSGVSDRRYRDDREPVSDRVVSKEKDVNRDYDWSERKHRDDREVRERERDRDRDRDRDRYREDRDRYFDHHRYSDREPENDDEWDRGRSSRTHIKSRLVQEEDQHSRSRDAEYGKRRRRSLE